MKKNSFKSLDFETLLDINYNLRREFGVLDKFPKRRRSNVFNSIFVFLAKMIKSFIYKEFYIPNLKDNLFCFLSTSKNNSKVIIPLYNSLQRSVGIGDNMDFKYPKFLAYWYSISYLLPLYKIYRNSVGYNRVILVSFFDLFLLTYGYLIVWNKILGKSNIKFVIMANDHLAYYRSVLYVLGFLDVKSVYLQHAGTSTNFPPLAFDYALLDGNVTKSNYLVHGNLNRSQIHLLGSIRFDKLAHLDMNRKSGEIIGLSLNLLDDLDRVVTFVSDLFDKGFKVIVRFHPGFKDNDIVNFKNKLNTFVIEFSDPNSESLESYLLKINLHFSGNSFIHFDAVLSGINSIKVPLSSYDSDPYDFVKDGFVEELPISQVHNYHFTWTVSDGQVCYLRNYIANYDQIVEGRSTLDSYIMFFSSLS